jgi:hypothetical protein
MSNDFYDSTGYPSTGAGGSSASMRAELDAIEAGFNKLPVLTGNGGKHVKVNAAGTALEHSSVISDNGTDVTVSGDLYVTGGQIGQNSGQKHTIPAIASDTLALLAAVQTFINKTLVASSNTITTAASGNLAATELNAALAELQADIDTRSPSSHTHTATVITNTPSGNLAATNVQAALNELQSEIDGLDASNYLQLAGGSLTGELNYERSTVAATATTTPLFAAGTGNVQDWTGTPTITAFPNAPQAGSQRIAYPAAGTIITHGGNISVQGNASYTVAAGDELTITAITTTTFYVTIDRKDGQSVGFKQIQPITASVGASALTVTLNPTSLDFRDSTLTSGTVNSRTVSSAISLVVPSGATLGTTSAVQSRLITLAIDNAGTVELAIVNLAGGNDLSETGVISTTALSTGSDSADVIYSTTARTNVAYRVVGYVESTQTTAGTWATAPSTIQGYGGQALSAMSSLGYGTVTQSSLALATTYYNTSGKPIGLNVNGFITVGGAGSYISCTVDGIKSYGSPVSTNSTYSVLTIPSIRPGGSYLFTLEAGGTVSPILVNTFK